MTCQEKAMTAGVLYLVELDDRHGLQDCGFLPRPLGTGLYSYHMVLG
ncbi:hypothetical protein [Pseudomonas oryzihabitans]|nr:hypothetical protein [Pseudomonas oryzihabitans]